MKTITGFFRREPVLSVAALAAAASCFLVPPDRAYLGYLDLRTLTLLYTLMLVVEGLRGAGVFERMAHAACRRAGTVREMGLLLTALTFFSAMLITNDVALLTFVPFALLLPGMAERRRELLFIVVLQTVAANLGSMLTPVGNPQNLYLYSRYALSVWDFLAVTLPFWCVSLALLLLLCLLLPRSPMTRPDAAAPGVDRRRLCLYGALLALCLLAVFRVIDWPLLLALFVAALLVFDRGMLLRADFMLLLTFVAFFVFAGNLARLDALSRLLRQLLSGREYLTALLTSQIISNVPAALLLSGFTDNARELLLGVDVGGLGTPVASLASLISLRLYSRAEGAETGRYLLVFTLVNLGMLAALSAVRLL